MTTTAANNRRTAIVAAGVALGMVALAYAAVPLYRIFCQTTGFGGTPQTATAASLPNADKVRALAGKTIRVRFDGNVRNGLPWEFAPAQGPIEVRIGEQNMAWFRATSRATTPTTGSATFNVSPPLAGQYFTKIQCFCFSEQTLAAGQTVEMPVVFYVDPAIVDDPDTKNVSEITLSYSFYPVAHPTAEPGIRATGKADIASVKR